MAFLTMMLKAELWTLQTHMHTHLLHTMAMSVNSGSQGGCGGGKSAR